MNKKEFMNQKMCDMTPIELAKAIILKEKENSCPGKPEPEFKVGDTVKIVQDWVNRVPSGRTGQIGKLIEVGLGGTYPYRVQLKDGDPIVHKIELVKAIILKEKETNSVPQPKFKVGDRVRVVQFWEDGRKASCDGLEGGYIGKVPDDGVYNGENRITLDDRDGGVYTAYKIELVKAKPKEEWKDITKECNYILDSDVEGRYWIGIIYKGSRIGSALGCRLKDKDERIISVDLPYKVEIDESKNYNHFKILKRCE